MRGLKLLVVVMGVMLIAGVAALVATLAVRLSQHATPAFTAPPLALPKGAKIDAMSIGPDRIVLNIVLADGIRQLLVLDMRTGRLIGTIPLREE
jgi:hypothetical protein